MGTSNGKPPFDFGGALDVTLLPDNRLRLPVGATNQLREAGVRGLRLSILPRHPALIVCPESRWPAWRGKVKAAFKDLPPGKRSVRPKSILNPFIWTRATASTCRTVFEITPASSLRSS